MQQEKVLVLTRLIQIEPVVWVPPALPECQVVALLLCGMEVVGTEIAATVQQLAT